ncbi:MAG: hypothetical protein KGJ86_05255, partial [Chloroflexota bacterium]|nr:hypothetical protein [Chloroflexota bacterium]
MSVRVNTNVDAFDAQRNLSLVSADFSKAVQQLSSGLRINGASDDAAGLAISEKLKTQINGFDQGTRNAQDSISMIQTAESALNTTHSILQRMRQLAVQAANDTYTSSDRANIQAEINQLISEVDRIAQQTDFNTKKLLDGTAGGAQFSGGGADIKGVVVQAGVTLSKSFTVSGTATSATRSAVESGATVNGSFFTTTSSITIQGGLGTETFTAQSGESLETFFQVVNNSGIGVTMSIQGSGVSTGTVLVYNNNYGINTTGSTVGGIANFGANTSGATSVSILSETGDFDTTGLAMKFGSVSTGSINAGGTFAGGVTAVNSQLIVGGTTLTGTGINADVMTGLATTAGLVITLANPGSVQGGSADSFSISQNATLLFQVGANASQTIGLNIDSANSQALGITSLDVLTQVDAETAMTQLDRAIQSISANRANMGAIINRLTNSMNNDMAAEENAMASNSRIRDVNVAQETVQFTRDQI